MKKANATNSRDVTHTGEGLDRKTCQEEDPRSKTPYQTPIMHPTSNVSAVHYNFTESGETEMQRHNVVKDDFL